MVKLELFNYDIFPKVFPCEKEIEVTIKPLGATLLSTVSTVSGSRRLPREISGIIRNETTLLSTRLLLMRTDVSAFIIHTTMSRNILSR